MPQRIFHIAQGCLLIGCRSSRVRQACFGAWLCYLFSVWLGNIFICSPRCLCSSSEIRKITVSSAADIIYVILHHSLCPLESTCSYKHFWHHSGLSTSVPVCGYLLFWLRILCGIIASCSAASRQVSQVWDCWSMVGCNSQLMGKGNQWMNTPVSISSGFELTITAENPIKFDFLINNM